MNVRIAPVMILAAVVLASVPDAAHAQPPLQRDTWLLSGALGLALDADANGSLTMHGAAAFPFTSELAVEGELGHVFDISPGNVGVDVSLTTVHGSMLYFINTPYVLTPYLAAGLGLGKYAVDVEGGPDFSTTELGFNLGAGVTYPLNNTTAFRGDFRYFKHIDDVPSVWRFTAGIAVRFGT
ncbi:MAG: outer membrane beta-barrel protein [Vicinamibacterales bacterium]